MGINTKIALDEETLDSIAEKSSVTTELISYLDADEPFDEIISNIMRITGEYLRCSNVGVLRLDERSRLDIFAEWTRGDKVEIFERACDDIWDHDLVHSREIYVMSANDITGKREYLYTKYGITSLVARTVVVQGKAQLVFAIADDTPNRVWTIDKIQFITNVVRMIESIIIKKTSRKSLFSSQTAMREILDNVGSGLFVIDKETHEILFCNEKMCSMVKTDMLGKKCSEFAICGNRKMCENCTKMQKSFERWETYDNRYQKWFDIRMSDITWVDGGRVALCNVTDITTNKKYEKRIEFQANNDFLTGLYNRMRCESDIYEVVDYAKKSGEKGYLMFIDLDDFKHINDGLGHQHGDMLLKMISMGLQQIDGISDNCYRVGGDEFIILVLPDQQHRVKEIIDDVHDMFNKPWLLNGTEYYSTMSMGVVCYPDDGVEVNDLIKKADIAMYDAKKAGKNRVQYYNAKDEKTSIKRLDVEKNMRSAIAVGGMEFELYIQPIVDALTGECTGGESLIRWNSSELGFLMPVDFIPLAEHLGLIVIIGEYFLRKACRINKEWSDRGIDKQLHVNLSIVQLVQNNVVETITNIIEETGVKPENIILEVTESLAINDITNMKRVIKEIKRLGVGIALDDFGTGYSSLNYIKQMDFDIIKVDKHFIDDLTTDDYAQTFIKLITELSDKLGAKVCVEGVEDQEQIHILRSMNVNMIQGYYYGKPVPYEEFEEKYLNIKR